MSGWLRGWSSAWLRGWLTTVCDIYRYGSQSGIKLSGSGNQKWSMTTNKWYFDHFAPSPTAPGQCRASDLTVRLHRLCSGCAATLALPTPSCTGSPYPWHPRTIERWAGACAAAVDGLQNRTAGCATARHSHLTVSECESISLNALVNERSTCSEKYSEHCARSFCSSTCVRWSTDLTCV